MSKPTQGELLSWVDCGYLANNPMFNRRFNERVRTQLKETIQQKPTVTREEISSAVHEGRNWDDGTFHEGDAQKALVELLKSKGVEVVE